MSKMLKKPVKVLKPSDVLKVIKGKVYLGKEELTASEIQNLKAEVLTFKQFRLRSIFYETLKQYAIDMGFNNATKWEETLAGKMMAHNAGVQEGIEHIIEKL